MERRALRSADLVFGDSRWVIDELQREGIKSDRVRLIHNGIEISPCLTSVDRAAVRTNEGWGDDETVIVAIANLIPYKGHIDLLHGARELKAQGKSNLRLLLVGHGAADYADSLQKLAAELEIDDRVFFAGSRADVARLLAGADIGVLPSHQEGFANALLEYMMAQLPIVATATGGNLDAVEEGRTGFLVPVGAPGPLGHALSLLVENADLRVRLGEAGRFKVETEFGLDRCATAYEAAYQILLARKDAASTRV